MSQKDYESLLDNSGGARTNDIFKFHAADATFAFHRSVTLVGGTTAG